LFYALQLRSGLLALDLALAWSELKQYLLFAWRRQLLRYSDLSRPLGHIIDRIVALVLRQVDEAALFNPVPAGPAHIPNHFNRSAWANPAAPERNVHYMALAAA
jgi:hypothetical protein